MRAPQLIFLRSGAGHGRPQRHPRLFEELPLDVVRITKCDHRGSGRVCLDSTARDSGIVKELDQPPLHRPERVGGPNGGPDSDVFYPGTDGATTVSCSVL
jgi:hypothetical protein